MKESGKPHPRVFIGYSHDDGSTTKRVRLLSDWLRENGVDCLSDQDDDDPPEGIWPWVEKQIGEADYVLAVCTEDYLKAFKGEHDELKGKGVAYEAKLIRSIISKMVEKNPKFRAVTFSANDAPHVPELLAVWRHYNLGKRGEWKKLLSYFLGKDADPTALPEAFGFDTGPGVTAETEALAEGEDTRHEVLPSGALAHERQFIERPTEIEAVIESLENPDFSITVVWGLPGCGKTAIAREIHRRVTQKRLSDGPSPPRWAERSIWFEARTEPFTRKNVVDAILYAYESIQTRRLPEDEQVAAVQNLMRARPCLLICDNVDRIPSEDVGAFVDFIRHMPEECRLLITTRDRNVVFPDGQFLPRTKILPQLGGMTEDQAVALARSIIFEVAVAQQVDETSLKDLVTACECHPLTIVLVTGQLRHSPPDEIVDTLSNWRAALTEKLSPGAWDSLCDDARGILHPEKVFRGVWERRLLPEARKILAVAALSGRLASESAILSIFDSAPQGFRLGRSQVFDMALLDPAPLIGGERYYRVHPLVLVWVLGSIDDDLKEIYHAKLARYYAAFLKQSENDLSSLIHAYEQMETELWNIVTATEWCFERKEQQNLGLEILLKFVRFLWNIGRWDTLTRLTRTALDHLELRNEARARLYCHLAWVHSRRNQFQEAEDLVKEAEDLVSDPSSSEAGHVAHSWGQIEYRRDNFPAAEGHMRRALDIYQRDSGPAARVAQADVWDNLGDLFRNRGLWHLREGEEELGREHLQKARQWYEKLLELAEKTGYAEKRATAAGDIGHVSLYLRHYEEAWRMLEQGLDLAKQIRRPHTIAYCELGLGELGSLSEDADRSVCLAHLERASDIYRLLGMTSVVEQIEAWQKYAKAEPPPFVHY